jgi:hypothetical protein
VRSLFLASDIPNFGLSVDWGQGWNESKASNLRQAPPGLLDPIGGTINDVALDHAAPAAAAPMTS